MKLIFSISLLICFSAKSQSFFEMEDTLSTRRIIGVGSGVGLLWSGSILALDKIWYDQYEKIPFHTFDDSREWLQMDKAGHIYTANKLALKSYELYRWTGLSANTSILLGSITGLGYQTSIEFLDGRSSGWGFSWPDMLANSIGTVSFAFQELAFEDQVFILKFSSHYSKYAKYRPEVLGDGFAQRLIKDYNGQTYWLSASSKSIFPNSRLPQWLCFSLGYSVDGKIYANEDTFVDGNNIIQAQREFLFSLDLDFSKLNVRKPWLKALVKQLNFIKIPFPSLILSDSQIRFSPLYF